MMPRALLHSLKASGIVLRAEGDRLKWRALEGCMAPKMLERIKANKAGLLALLHANQADTYNKDSETAIGETQPIALLTQGSYKPPLLLPEHLSDGWPYRNKIILGDCFELITKLEDNSVDLVITSPPYADVVSYGKGVDIYHADDYANWILPLFSEIHSVLKPSGSFILNINDRIVKKQRHTYVFELVYRAVKESNLKLYDRYFWVKKNAQPNCNRKRLSNGTEYLFHFCKDVDLIKWNMDAVREPYNKNTLSRGQYPVTSTQFKVDESGIPLARSKRMRKAHEKGKIPSNVFQFPTAASIKDKKHPAVFHIDLPIWFIKALTDEGDLIWVYA